MSFSANSDKAKKKIEKTRYLFCTPVRFALLLIFFLCGTVTAQNIFPVNRKVPFAVPPPCMELRGFSFNETTGRWTSGSRAVITFFLPADVTDKPASLDFELDPFIIPGKVPVQRVTVLVEHKLAAFWQCSKPGIYSIPLRSEQIKDGRLSLVFLLPDCYRPPDAEDDPYVRTFSLFFRSVTLKKEGGERKVRQQPIVIRGKNKKFRNRVSGMEKQKTASEKSHQPEPNPVKQEPEQILPVSAEPEKVPAESKITAEAEKNPEKAEQKPVEKQDQKPSPMVEKTHEENRIFTPPSSEKTGAGELQALPSDKEILFSEENHFFLTSGFSDREKDGRKTNAHAAFLRVVLPNLRTMPLPALEFEAEPASDDSVETVIRLNENTVGKWKCVYPGKYYILLSGISRKGGPLTITFELPGAKVPESMKDMPGARILGLHFRSVKLLSDYRKVQQLRGKPEKAKMLSELLPFPVEKRVTPGRCGKLLFLNGFQTDDLDGDGINQDKVSSFTFRVPEELFKTSPVAAFEIEPIVTAEMPVRYLNVSLNGVPADCLVCTGKQKFYVRLKQADDVPVTITLECAEEQMDKYGNAYRLKNVSLLRESFVVPQPLIEQENQRAKEEFLRKWNAGKLD